MFSFLPFTSGTELLEYFYIWPQPKKFQTSVVQENCVFVYLPTHTLSKEFPAGNHADWPNQTYTLVKYIIFIIFRNMITCPGGYLTMDLKLDYESLNDLKGFQGKTNIGLWRTLDTFRSCTKIWLNSFASSSWLSFILTRMGLQSHFLIFMP